MDDVKRIPFRAAMKNAVSFVNVNVTSEPYEVSLLWFLWYLASAGGPLRINATSNGGQVLLATGVTGALGIMEDRCNQQQVSLQYLCWCASDD